MSHPHGPWSYLVLALSLSACGGSSTPAPASPEAKAEAPSLDAERARARALIARACACADRACLLSVAAELEGVLMTFGEALQTSTEISACHQTVDHKNAAIALQEIEQLHRDACLCTDAACADGIQARFTDFMERHKNSKGSETQAQQAGEEARMMMECMVKAKGDPLAPGGG